MDNRKIISWGPGWKCFPVLQNESVSHVCAACSDQTRADADVGFTQSFYQIIGACAAYVRVRFVSPHRSIVGDLLKEYWSSGPPVKQALFLATFAFLHSASVLSRHLFSMTPLPTSHSGSARRCHKDLTKSSGKVGSDARTRK